MQKFAYPDDQKSDILENLVGAELQGGWKVTQRLSRKSFQSGSCFSVGYIVEKGGEKAFMKAFDFFEALQKDDPIAALNDLTETYLFERELLESCGAAKMTKVVKAIASGTVDEKRAPLGKLFYLLFELADGDVRTHLHEKSGDVAWRLSCLHHIAIALQQLHRRGIYHQDLKPSNVLVFIQSAESKLGDLGRAHWTSKQAPHDSQAIPGAFRYAPPELLYRAPLSEQLAQKSASDLYLFGSMICFFATGMALTPLWLSHLSDEHQPFVAYGKWRGFFKDVLPYLTAAYEAALNDVRTALETELGDTKNARPMVDELMTIMRYASEPDPQLRGHPLTRKRRHGNPYDLERFVAASDLLARRARIALNV